MTKYFFIRYEEEEGEDISQNPKAKVTFKAAACQLKLDLAAKNATEGTFTPDNFEFSDPPEITPEDFAQICKPVLDQILKPIGDVLRNTGLSVLDIDRVILVGGSTRIPCVR